MVVDLSFIVHLELSMYVVTRMSIEWLDQVEEQPDVDHLYVGGLGKVVADIDEHCCED